jgi:hypothetical protein
MIKHHSLNTWLCDADGLDMGEGIMKLKGV